MFKTKGGGGGQRHFEKLQYWSGQASVIAQEDRVQKKQNVVWSPYYGLMSQGGASTQLFPTYV